MKRIVAALGLTAASTTIAAAADLPARVYTKAPVHAADKHRPFTLRRGQTVGDVARLVHQDLARSLRYARIWGHSAFEGQQVGPEHCVADGDIVELHA